MNKLKNNNSLIQRIPFLAVLAAVLIAVPLRVYQYLKLINPSTGFYDINDFSIVVVYGVLAIAMVVCIALSYINHKSIQTVTIEKYSKTFLAVSLIMAAGAMFSAVDLITDFIDLLGNAPKYLDRNGLSDYISAQGGVLIIFEGIFAALSGFYFIISGLSSLNENPLPKFRLLALSPVIWCVFRLLYRFKRTIAFTNVSDLLIELFAIVFAMVFFLALAQIRSKIDADSIFWKIYAYGLPAAMFAIVCFVPRFILLITGKSEMINALHPVYVSDITFAVYAIYVCISSSKAKSKSIENN